MIRQLMYTSIFSALCLVPYSNAAEKQDQLDTMLQEKFLCYQDQQETRLQKSWRLAKEYGPFVTSVALGSYLAYTSIQQKARRIVPELVITGINAYALYKSHSMAKQWLTQLPTERTYPFQLMAPSAISLATFYFSNTSFFEPNYIATLSSLTVFVTSVWRFSDANEQHRQDKNIIHDTEMNTTKIMLNDFNYADKKSSPLAPNATDFDTEKHHGTLWQYRLDNQETAENLKNNTGTIMQRPWGSQYFAGLSKNSRHAIFKSVGWQIDYPDKHELAMGAEGYPEKFAVPKVISDLYAPKKS